MVLLRKIVALFRRIPGKLLEAKSIFEREAASAAFPDMTRLPILLIVVALAGSCQSDVQDGRPAITSLISEFNDAVRNNDSDRLLQLFMKDGDYAVGTSAPKP